MFLLYVSPAIFEVFNSGFDSRFVKRQHMYTLRLRDFKLTVVCRLKMQVKEMVHQLGTYFDF